MDDRSGHSSVRPTRLNKLACSWRDTLAATRLLELGFVSFCRLIDLIQKYCNINQRFVQKPIRRNRGPGSRGSVHCNCQGIPVEQLRAPLCECGHTWVV